jgi:O-antigen/teichoic acid export membrane protein
MTTKVVKGSIWTFAGQAAPLAASLVATPFIIRLLGAESYGVFVLICLIPTYIVFADLGMGLGSTKFGSEAYARGSGEAEAKVVRTAALIAFLASCPFAAAIFIFSLPILRLLNVPEHLLSDASIALRIVSITVVTNFLNLVINTPQMTRLRMDLNTLVNSGVRIVSLLTIPVVLYLGGGIIGAVTVMLVASVLTLAGHLAVSRMLLRDLLGISINRELIRPLLKFGGPLAVSVIAATLLGNVEKLVLTRVTTVETLAFYSVAFTFATMATLFSSAMGQSLIPAFSQLLTNNTRDQLNNLFSRSLRINILGFIPLLVFLFAIARPFFTIWAGEDFGRESTLPFYVLLLGLLFNLVAYVPYSTLMAAGRTGIFAKLYWLELMPYVFAAAFLTISFGAVGAAAAWSLRVIVDAVLIVWLAKQSVGVSINIFHGKGLRFLLLLVVLTPPLLVVGFIGYNSIWLVILYPLCVTIYLLLVWKNFLESEEKVWLSNTIHAVLSR